MMKLKRKKVFLLSVMMPVFVGTLVWAVQPAGAEDLWKAPASADAKKNPIPADNKAIAAGTARQLWR